MTKLGFMSVTATVKEKCIIIISYLFKTMIPCIRILKLENQIENYLLSFSIYLFWFLNLWITFSSHWEIKIKNCVGILSCHCLVVCSCLPLLLLEPWSSSVVAVWKRNKREAKRRDVEAGQGGPGRPSSAICQAKPPEAVARSLASSMSRLSSWDTNYIR